METFFVLSYFFLFSLGNSFCFKFFLSIFIGEHPGNTTGSCASVMGNKVYLFAGFHQQDSHTNKLFSLDLKTLTWCDCTEKVKGFRPSSRDKFGCWKFKQKIIYFGGFGHPPLSSRTKGEFYFEELPDVYSRGFGWNNQVHVLDCSDVLVWNQPDCKGDTPCPRAAFAVSQIGSTGYLFGGRFKDDRRNDLYSIDLETYIWKRIKIANIAPCGRSWHVMVPVSDKHLFVYGGLDSFGTALKDVWIFNIENSDWIELENATNYLACFAPRLWHTACHTDWPGEIVIFGGCSNSVFGTDLAIHTNIVAVFRFSPLPLRRLCLDTVMQNFEKHCDLIEGLPRSLQRNINYRCHALGLHCCKAHGKLVNTCQIT